MGIVVGLLGGGGSILTVPILIFLAGLDTRESIATSLLVVSLTSAFALFRHARAGRVRWAIGAVFGAVSMVGAYVGGRVAGLIPSDVLLGAFVAMMLVTGVMMLRPRRPPSRPEPGSNPAEGSTASPPGAARPSFFRIGLIGLLMGSVTGLIGAGGGFMIVPSLVLFGGLLMPEAVATSLMILTLNAMSGYAGHAGETELDVRLTGFVVVTAMVGAWVGTAFAGKVPGPQLRRAFGVLVLVMAVVTITLKWLE